MFISNICICGFMCSVIKKSWKVSNKKVNMMRDTYESKLKIKFWIDTIQLEVSWAKEFLPCSIKVNWFILQNSFWDIKQKCRPCPFIQILSWFNPDLILILSWFYPDFILILFRFYPDFIQIFWKLTSKFYPDFILIFENIWIKSG